MEFIIGGMAGAGATIFTNPMDVIKIRLQLQGEMQAGGRQSRLYRGVAHGMYVVAKNEGMLALQKGLVSAMILGFNANSIRLGLYRISERHGWTKNQNGDIVVLKAMAWSCLSGGLCGVAANPAYVIKTRLQSSAHQNIAVGHQHKYTGTLDAVKTIYKHNGIKGFFAGLFATCFRAKEQLLARSICKHSPTQLAFVASMFSGAAVSVAMCPLDVVTTRLYNQGNDSRGAKLYNGIWDCFTKTFKAEGLHGLYKGVGPLYLRLAPHTTISLVFWDRLNSYFK